MAKKKKEEDKLNKCEICGGPTKGDLCGKKACDDEWTKRYWP